MNGNKKIKSLWNTACLTTQLRPDALLNTRIAVFAHQAALQVGGHGERLMQCQTVRLTTYKTIPMQVDGERCRLQPSIVRIYLHNQANMVQKPKRRGSVPIGNE